MADELSQRTAADRVSAVRACCELGDLASVKTQLAATDVNATGEDGRTPLIYAAVKGHTAVVEYLLANNADVHATTDRGWGALLYTAVGGHLETARPLVAAKADAMQETKEGWSALTAAVKQGHMALAMELSTAQATVVALEATPWTLNAQLSLLTVFRTDRPFAGASSSRKESRGGGGGTGGSRGFPVVTLPWPS
jgi:ankyrin repeat protein